MKLQSIFVTDENYPLIGTPLFADEDGKIYSQNSDDGAKITSFVSVVVDESHRKKVRGVQDGVRNIGDPVLYSIALSESWFLVGDADKLREEVNDSRYKPILADSPFVRLEIARIIRDDSMIGKSIVECAVKLSGISKKIASHWRISSNLSPDVDLEIEKAISAKFRTDYMVAIRMSLPTLGMALLDLFADEEKAPNRSTFIRHLLDKNRNEFEMPEFWADFEKETLDLKHNKHIGRDFYKDDHYVDVFLSKISRKDVARMPSKVAALIEYEYGYKRATVRIPREDQGILIKMAMDGALFRSDIRGIEEYYGFLFLFLAIRLRPEGRKKLMDERDHWFQRLRHRTRSSLK